MVLVAFLGGCASVAPYESTDASDSNEENAEVGDTTAAAQLPDGSVGKSSVGTSPVGLSPDDEVFSENQAVTHLLDRAEQAVKVNDFSLAEALADRALRIQRTAARAYLLLAMVQLDQGDLRGASDLARQGLLYTPEDSFLEGKLLDVLRAE